MGAAGGGEETEGAAGAAGTAGGGRATSDVGRGGSRRRAPAGENVDDYDTGYRDGIAHADELAKGGGAGGYADQTAQQPRAQRMVHPSTDHHPSAVGEERGVRRHHHHHAENVPDMAGAAGGLADPEDEYESRIEHSEYIPESKYGTTAAPRRNPSRTKKGGEAGAVAGGGHPSEQPSHEYAAHGGRRHSLVSGFRLPFTKHHEDAREAARAPEVPTSGEHGTASTGAAGADATAAGGAGVPIQRPRTGSVSSTAHNLPSKVKELVVGVKHHHVDEGGVNAGRCDYGMKESEDRVVGDETADMKATSPYRGGFAYDQMSGEYPQGTHRYAHRGSATAASAANRGNSSAYNDSYNGGYEAGYLAAKQGKKPPWATTGGEDETPQGTGGLTGAGAGKQYREQEEDPTGGFSRTAGMADDTTRNVPESGLGRDGHQYDTTSKSNPFKQGRREGEPRYEGTGAERYGAYTSEGNRNVGNLGGSEAYGYGEGSSPADKFSDKRLSSGGPAAGAYEHEMKSPSYGRSDGMYAGGGHRETAAGRQLGVDEAGYERSLGSDVGPGSAEYPEDYDNLRNPGAGRLGTRRSIDEEDFDRGAKDTSGGLGGAAAGGAAASGGHGFGGISKAADKFGGADKIKGSLDKAANSKMGGMAKGKAGDFAKSKLGQGKAGELAGKAKNVPGAEQAANKAQDFVGKGISSKFGGGGAGGAGDAAGATTGAAGAGGAVSGAAVGQKGTGRGKAPRDYDSGDYGDRGYGKGVRHGGAYDEGYNAGLRYGARGGGGGGAARRADDHGAYNEEYMGGAHHGRDFQEGDMRGQGGVLRDTSTRKPVREEDVARRAPRETERSYGRPEDQDRGYPPDFAVGSGEGSNRRLRRGPEGEEHLGVSDGDQIPTSEERGYQKRDDIGRQASPGDNAFYDANEGAASPKKQAAAKKPGRRKSLKETEKPPLRGFVDADTQDTDVPRLGFQGLFGRKKSAGGTVTNGNGEPVTKSKSMEERGPGKSADSDTAKNYLEPRGPKPGVKVFDQGQHEQPSSEESKRFAQTFGNNPSLIDPNVPTYGFGTHSQGPPSAPASSTAGRAEDKERSVPGISSPKNAGKEGTTNKMKKSGSYPPRSHEEGEGNYLPTGKTAHNRNVSVGSEEIGADKDAYHKSKGLSEEYEPSSVYSDNQGNFDESSKVPRRGPDEADEIAPPVEGTHVKNEEPSIFEKIKNTILPGGEEHPTTEA